jgi:hypothetical protein
VSTGYLGASIDFVVGKVVEFNTTATGKAAQIALAFESMFLGIEAGAARAFAAFERHAADALEYVLSTPGLGTVLGLERSSYGCGIGLDGG